MAKLALRAAGVKPISRVTRRFKTGGVGIPGNRHGSLKTLPLVGSLANEPLGIPLTSSSL